MDVPWCCCAKILLSYRSESFLFTASVMRDVNFAEAPSFPLIKHTKQQQLPSLHIWTCGEQTIWPATECTMFSYNLKREQSKDDSYISSAIHNYRRVTTHTDRFSHILSNYRDQYESAKHDINRNTASAEDCVQLAGSECGANGAWFLRLGIPLRRWSWWEFPDVSGD
jgi:hypothetical protein